MTLEEFHEKSWERFKKIMIFTAIYLAVMIPTILYNPSPRSDIFLAIVLSGMFTGTIACWADYDEVRKAAKKNRGKNEALHAR